MGNMFGIICRLCKNDLKETDDKKENYDYKENDNINTKIYPKYLSQETRVNKYFLQLKYNNDNIILYKSNIIDDKETRDRKFNSILLKNIKKYGYQIQKNVYIYENNVYKFTINNNTNLIKDIYNLLERVTFDSAEALDGLMDRISQTPGEMFGGKLQELITAKVDAATRMFKQRMLQFDALLRESAILPNPKVSGYL